MASLLLPLIYIAFISLGLPDALLGAAWPNMYVDLSVSVSAAGVVSFIISAGTVVSALSAEWLHAKLGTGKIIFFSVGLTAVALLGFSMSASFFALCCFAIPYGLGAGSVDAVLNNYVALHYKARHMSWLHCMWGVGASIGPLIMGAALSHATWNTGYLGIALFQFALTVVLFLSIRRWKDGGAEPGAQSGSGARPSLLSRLRIPGVKQVLCCFFCYCAIETTTGMWAASYCSFYRGIAPDEAAGWASLFYIGITIGRFASGFVTFKMDDRNLIRLGQAVIAVGALLVALPVGNSLLPVGLLAIGLGCAPIYPSIIHETPINFGKENSQGIIGLQMASAYVGSTLVPPLFGLIAERVSFAVYPLFVGLILILMFVMAEWLHKLTLRPRPAQ